MIVFLTHILIITSIYSLVVLGLQISVGRGRVMLIAPTVFFAVGAYTYAILTTTYDWNPLLVSLVAPLGGAVCGYLIGALATRLSGDHLVLASLGLCEIARSCLNNWDGVTNGSIGIMNIPFVVDGLSRSSHLAATTALCIVLVAVTVVFSFWLSRQPFGLIHASFDGDEAGVASIGKRVASTKRVGVAIGALIAAAGGVLFAGYTSYIDPTTFTVGESIMMFAMLTIGGFGNPYGALLGATVFVVLPEALRFVGLPDDIADPTRRMICGALLLLAVRFRPYGLIPDRRWRTKNESTT